MFVKNTVLAIATVVLCLISCCTALNCTGGVYQAIDKRCVQSCGERDKCLCAKDDTPSNITGCLQRCERHPHGNPNITVNKCLDMECTNLETCFQVCRSSECKMQCKATKSCSQECGNAHCSKVVCSAATCIQECVNCTMECTSEVKSCQQLCRGGVCYSICDDKNTKCSRNCGAGPGVKCQIVKSASAPTPTPLSIKVSSLSSFSLILVSVLLVIMV